MKHLLILILLFASVFAIGQNRCNLSSLPKESKSELITFWETLKIAVQQKDTTKLISLSDFPFYLSKEILLLDNENDDKNNTLDSNRLKQNINSIYFEEHFFKAISQYSDPTKCLFLHGDHKQKHKTCDYVFCYMFTNGQGNNEERCFAITKIDSVYKLRLHWIRHS